MCAVGPMSISDACYLFFFFFFFLFVSRVLFFISIIRSVAMHAFVRLEECRSENLFFLLCMNSNRSAGDETWRRVEERRCIGGGGKNCRETGVTMSKGLVDRLYRGGEGGGGGGCRGLKPIQVCLNNVGYLCTVLLWSLG